MLSRRIVAGLPFLVVALACAVTRSKSFCKAVSSAMTLACAMLTICRFIVGRSIIGRWTRLLLFSSLGAACPRRCGPLATQARRGTGKRRHVHDWLKDLAQRLSNDVNRSMCYVSTARCSMSTFIFSGNLCPQPVMLWIRAVPLLAVELAVCLPYRRSENP